MTAHQNLRQFRLTTHQVYFTCECFVSSLKHYLSNRVNELEWVTYLDLFQSNFAWILATMVLFFLGGMRDERLLADQGHVFLPSSTSRSDVSIISQFPRQETLGLWESDFQYRASSSVPMSSQNLRRGRDKLLIKSVCIRVLVLKLNSSVRGGKWTRCRISLDSTSGFLSE